MKKVVFVLSFVSILFYSCGMKGKYHIAGECKGAFDGDVVTLSYSNDGRHLHEIAKCEIKNEKFSFDGYVNDCKICYIGDESLQSPQYVMFFLEEGNMVATFSGTDGYVTGTKTNDLYQAATDSIENYLDALSEIEEKIVRSGTDDIVKDSLGMVGYNMQYKITEYIRNIVNDNIENLFGLYMLVVYNEFFDSDELEELIERIPETSIDRKNNSLYDLIVEIEAIRNRSESFEELLFDI